MEEFTALVGPLWLLFLGYFGVVASLVLSLAIMIRVWLLLGAATTYLKRKTFMLGA